METIRIKKFQDTANHYCPELEDIDNWEQWIKYKIHISWVNINLWIEINKIGILS